LTFLALFAFSNSMDPDQPQQRRARRNHKLLYAIKSLDVTAGGAEKGFTDVATGMVEKGYGVTVLTFDPPGSSSFYPMNDKIRRINLGIGDTAQKTTIAESLKRISMLRKVVQDEKPDTVIAFMHSMFVPMALALVGTGIPVIASEHTVPEHYRGKLFEFFMFIFSAIFVRRITVLSDDVKDLYPTVLRPRMYTMPNPIKVVQNNKKRGEYGERKVILNVGRLDPKKDQRTLVQAFATLAKDYPEWDLKIIGEGPMRSDLELLINVLDMQDRVFLPGTTKEIEKEYQQAEFFVTASQYESLGMSTVEALSHGLPAIGFQDCPGTNKIIQEGKNGMLLPSRNRILMMANAMKKLVEDDALRFKLSEAAPASVETFQSENIYRNWDKLIRYVNFRRVNFNPFTGRRVEERRKKSAAKSKD